MVKASTKLFFTGIAGAAGVVATTQIPDVKAAVNTAINVTSNEKQVGRFSNVATFIHEKSSQVTMKSDILREKHTKDAKLATFKEGTKQVKSPKSNLNTVASKAMTDAISASNSQSDATAESASYYDDSTTAETDIQQPTTPAEDAVVAESDATDAVATSSYMIQDGDTLATVAANNGVSIDALQAANPNADTTMLSIGQSLSIPNGGYVDTTVEPASTVPDQEYTDQAAQSIDATTTYSNDNVTDPSVASEPVQQSYDDTTLRMQAATVDNSDDKLTVKSLGVAAPKQAPAATTMSNGDVVLNSLDATVAQDNSSVVAQDDNDTKAITQTKTATALTADQRSSIVSAAKSFAEQQIPYVWGGKTTAGLDASGLTASAYHEAGVYIPSHTIAQEAHMTTSDVQSSIDVMQIAQPGDLLFWGGHGASWQVAIYIGNGQYVIAAQPGQQARVMSLADSEILPDFVGVYNFK